MMIKERKETFKNNWPIMFPNDFLQKFFSQWTSNNWSIIHLCENDFREDVCEIDNSNTKRKPAYRAVN